MQHNETVTMLSEYARRYAHSAGKSRKTEFSSNSWLLIVGTLYLVFGLIGYLAAA